MDSSILFPPYYVLFACIVGLIGVGGYYLLVARKRLPMIPHVPVAPNNSLLFGWTTFSSTAHDILSLMDELGPMVQGRALNRNVLSIRDPELARQVLRDVKGKGFFHNPAPKLIRQSTFSLDTGPKWHQRRSCFRQAFSQSALRPHLPGIDRMATKLCTALDKVADTEHVVKIDELFAQLTIGVICEAAFDLDMSAFDGPENDCSFYGNTLREVFKYGWISMVPLSFLLYHLPIPPFCHYKAARTHYLKLRIKILAHIRRLDDEGNIRKGSLAESILMFSKLPGVVEDDVLSEIGLFFVAGMDTTAHTLAFAIYGLAKNPSVQQKAHGEVDGCAADKGTGAKMDEDATTASTVATATTSSTATTSVLPPYLEAVLKESMRKYPTASTGSMREVNMPEGYDLTPEIHLPKGWWINVQCFALHNSKAIWGDNANEFYPERWLTGHHNAGSTDGNTRVAEDSEEGSTDRHKPNPLSSPAAYGGVGMTSTELCFMPFSFGIRNCVGMNLAMMELRIALLALVKQFRFELADESMLNEKDALVVAFTMHPADMLPVKVYRRNVAACG